MLQMSFWTTLCWRQQRAHHEVDNQVVPRSGWKQHRVTGTGEPHQLDVDTLCRQALRERESLAGIGDAIRRAVREKQPLRIQRRNAFARRQPRGQSRHAVHNSRRSHDVVGHPQRDPTSHGVPNQAYWQVAETLGDLITRPWRIWHGRLEATVPPANRIPKFSQDNSALACAHYAATKGNHPQNRRIKSSNGREAVSRATMQEQHDSLGGRGIADDPQAGRGGHLFRILAIPVNCLDAI